MRNLYAFSLFLSLLVADAKAVWNEGYFLVEQAFQQTSADTIQPLNSQNTRLKLTIRNTAPNQTALISYRDQSGASATLNPITEGQLIGAHYNLFFGFTDFASLLNSFPAGAYNLNLTRSYHNGTIVNLNPIYAFSGVSLIPTAAPTITGGVWSNGMLQFTGRVMTVSWVPWTNALNSDSAISIEITQRGGGGAGGGIRSVYNSPIVWSNLSSNAIYDAELQFMNLEMKTSLSDSQQGGQQEFRLYHATTTKFAFKTGSGTNTSGGSFNPVVTNPVTSTNKTLLYSYTNRFSPEYFVGSSNQHRIRWFAEDRLKYQVKESLDLTSWTNFRGEMTGGGFDTEISFYPSNTKAFYQIQRSGEFIIEAKYGANDTFADVTNRVNSLKNTFNGIFTVSNSNLGGDPIFGFVKYLYVTVAKSDGVYLYTAREGSSINLNQ